MVAVDLLSLLLAVGLVVLVISTTVMVLTTAPARRDRRSSTRALSPSAEHALALARARAEAHANEETPTVPPTTSPLVPAGQIIEVADGPPRGRGASNRMSVEDAHAIAEHVAATDPQFVAEVISQWIRADSSEPDVRR